jgi:hypothetical protein
MSRQAWLKHINTVRFERGPDGKFDKASVQAHAASCPECAKRRATRRANKGARERADAYRSLARRFVKCAFADCHDRESRGVVSAAFLDVTSPAVSDAQARGRS